MSYQITDYVKMNILDQSLRHFSKDFLSFPIISVDTYRTILKSITFIYLGLLTLVMFTSLLDNGKLSG